MQVCGSARTGPLRVELVTSECRGGGEGPLRRHGCWTRVYDPEQRLGLTREIDNIGRANIPQRAVLLRCAALVFEGDGRIRQERVRILPIDQRPRHGPVDLSAKVFFTDGGER